MTLITILILFYDSQQTQHVSTFILTIIHLSATCLNKETGHKHVITSGNTRVNCSLVSGYTKDKMKLQKIV